LYEVIILGAGASGLFLGDLLKKNYLIIEHNEEIGKKIKVSGGGKCNITNKYVSFKNYNPPNDFVKKALEKFDNKDLLNWLKKRNLNVYERKKNQYFFKSSSELLRYFKKNVKNIKLNCEIIDVNKKKDFFEITTSKGVFKAKKLVVATGGKSYKSLGASEIGYKIARKFSHTVTPLKPALCGFTVQKEEFWFKKLSGVSVEVKLYVKNKIFEDSVLFSHKGITGPAVLNASLWWEKGKIKIDFLKEDIDKFLKNPNKQIITQLPLPRRFIIEFLKNEGIKDKKIKFLTKEEKNKLKKLNSYEFAPAGTFGFERAEVTKGGVNCKELDENMQSKIVKNLYFIGEVCDVTGELGGYNFQWAFSSAFCCFLSL
jgi:predicted Rossmann fold flavoprotein